MAGVNKVILLGHLGKDPEIINTNSGMKIAKFSLATSEAWTDRRSGEKQEKTEWHNVVVFNEGIAKVVEQYLKKGAQVYIEGKLQTRKWQDREGKDRWSTEIVLDKFNSTLQMCGKRESGGGGARREESDSQQFDYDNSASRGGGAGDEEIPF